MILPAFWFATKMGMAAFVILVTGIVGGVLSDFLQEREKRMKEKEGGEK